MIGLEQQRRSQAAAAAAAELEAQELLSLLSALKAYNKGAFLVVTNNKGDAFAGKALGSYARKKCGLADRGSVLENARAVVSFFATASPPLAMDFGPVKDALRLKHALVRGAIRPSLLAERFPAVKAAYVQQPLDYGRNSRYGDKWKISCYLVVLEKWKPKIMPHEPMVRAMGDVMVACCRQYEKWYVGRFGVTSCAATVMNCFLTRYRPMPNEDELKRHIDGANVDGSVILALPTDEPFEGGRLKVWDGGKKNDREHVYAMKPGDCVFLDTRVFHQGCPISSGARYSLVLFLRLKTTR